MTQDATVPRTHGAPGDRDTRHDPATSDVARDEASRVAGTATDEASRLRAQASGSVKSVADEARSQVRGITDTAIAQVRERADHQVGQAGDSLHRTSGQLQALARGNPDEAGPMADYAQSAADAVAGWADRLGDGGIDGLLGDMSDFARRKPGQFLAGALLAGIVAGRVGRSVQAADVQMPEHRDAGPHDGAGVPGATESFAPTRTPRTSVDPFGDRETDGSSSGDPFGDRETDGSPDQDWIDDLDRGAATSTPGASSELSRDDAIEGRP